jgi:hypothetical protein
LAIFYQSTLSLKVQLFQIVKLRLEIEAPSLELQVPQPLLLVTQKMERKLELDFPVEAEELSLVTAELWSALLLAVEELTSPS